MKLKLTTCQSRYYTKDFKSLDVYKKYGFEFHYDSTYQEYIIKGNPEIDINSIDELIEISKEFGADLIVSDNSEIKIYDGYIE